MRPPFFSGIFSREARGVQKQTSVMVTSALRGVFTNPETRMEFLSIINR